MKDSVIIVSGGMDSITMLYEFKDQIALGVSFNYGSNHNNREIPFAEMHCKRLGIPHITIDLGFMPQYFKSSLLEGADAIPEGNYDEENMKSTVVPFRNEHSHRHSREQPPETRADGQPRRRPHHLSRLSPRICRRHVGGSPGGHV